MVAKGHSKQEGNRPNRPASCGSMCWCLMGLRVGKLRKIVGLITMTDLIKIIIEDCPIQSRFDFISHKTEISNKR